MRESRLGQAYHVERALAARQGIRRYPCGCEKCHGFKVQATEVVESHHRKYGRDRKLEEPLLRNSGASGHPTEERNVGACGDFTEEVLGGEKNDVEVEDYLDAEDYLDFEDVSPNAAVNFEQMAQNYFACVDKIHQQCTDEEDSVIDLSDVSSEEDASDVLEEVLRQSAEPLFSGSNASSL